LGWTSPSIGHTQPGAQEHPSTYQQGATASHQQHAAPTTLRWAVQLLPYSSGMPATPCNLH
jgi:hypothetical protein